MMKRLLNACLVVLLAFGLTPPGAPAVAATSVAPGAWSPTGSMGMPRVAHTATLLPDGRVLVVGGAASTGPEPVVLASAELYDSAGGTWSPTAPMSLPRGGHTATLLQDGRVLVAGGDGDPASWASAEIYDPVTETWSSTGALQVGRALHSATLLQDGRVLVAGGIASDRSSTELYDPATGTWSQTGSLTTGRDSHTATLLPDGRVLVVGGYGDTGFLASTEIY
ncbi:MAG TPA: kelch repeat-containing protein, partial [Anaerolineae bacterium]|nr:kelch repeat-containing protein [Anaerolineae bacterium]